MSRYKGKIFAIDGPTGSGKTTTARELAGKVDFIHLESGAMYRALAWFALKYNIDPKDSKKMTAAARKVPLALYPEQGRIIINGIDVTAEIKVPEVNRCVAQVAAHKGVRKAMIIRQRQLARDGSVVAEGKDTTTTVFPGADIKVYLDASREIRAERRFLELTKMGIETTREEQLAENKKRDIEDFNRKYSPLQKASDAFVLDTSDLTVADQVDRILWHIKSVLK